LCDGLDVGFLGLSEGLKILYPEGKIDRTNTRVISKGSPCLADAAIYLCGARYQYNTFFVSNKMDGIYFIQRIDNNETVSVHLNKGVRPSEIDILGNKAIQGELNSCELEQLKELEDNFTSYLLNSNPMDNFTVKEEIDFQWEAVLRNDFVKTDILNKNKQECK
jgi:formylmethanofuran dehydrogenase subunit E